MFTVWRSFIALALVVMLVSAGGILGYGMGFSHYQPKVSSLEQQLKASQTELADTKTALSQAQSKLSDGTAHLRRTQDDAHRAVLELDQVRGQLGSARVQADKLAGDLGATILRLDIRELQLTSLLGRELQWEQLRQVVDQMGNDRQLLAELRQQTPSTKEEAIRYWENVKRLAAQSDTRLSPKVDQVIAATRTFFDWQDSLYTNQDERNTGFFLTGAYLLPSVTSDLMDSVFLVVVARIDAALQQAQALG
ncbi:MAG: hypothetical protein HYY01_05685 [Chloroflexi bacterium]|nr:hypothetical protein [Chloroflexota bacterium]